VRPIENICYDINRTPKGTVAWGELMDELREYNQSLEDDFE